MIAGTAGRPYLTFLRAAPMVRFMTEHQIGPDDGSAPPASPGSTPGANSESPPSLPDLPEEPICLRPVFTPYGKGEPDPDYMPAAPTSPEANAGGAPPDRLTDAEIEELRRIGRAQHAHARAAFAHLRERPPED